MKRTTGVFCFDGILWKVGDGRDPANNLLPLLHRRRWTGRNDARVSPCPRRRRYDRSRKTCGFSARFSRRHDPSLDPRSFEGRGMDRVAAKIAQKICMFFENDRIDTDAGKEKPE